MLKKIFKNSDIFDAALLTLVFFCVISLSGAAVYYFYSLNKTGVATSLLLAALLFIFILKIKKKYKEPKIKNSGDKLIAATRFYFIDIFFIITYLLLNASCFYILLSSQTARALISPWQVIPDYFFLLYGLATFILIIVLNKKTKAFLPLISIHYFLSFSVALIIYKIGYGFDPFIHRATMELIDKIGSLEPKPLYYLGQYGLIIIVHKITFIPIVWLDKLLVPFLAAAYLPLISFYALNKWLADKKEAILPIILFLALPFSFFIITAPQNFSYLLLILTIIIGLAEANIYNLTIIYLLSATALAVHPLAGIPAFIFSLFLTVFRANCKKWKKIFYPLLFLISTAILPLIFYFFEKNKAQKINLNESSFNVFCLIKKGVSALAPVVPGNEDIFLNFAYLYFFNLRFIIILLAILGVLLYLKRKNELKIIKVYLTMAASLLISFALIKILPFNFLIDYERSAFSDRIIIMAAFFLWPLFALLFYSAGRKIKLQKINIKISAAVFAAAVITASLYLSYPRLDKYFNSRGYSVSQNDLNAVNWIEKNAEKNYLVLANQQVSAAALSQFGFKKYYHGDIFFYPVPTGAPLYKYYLDMVYKKPSRKTMLAAMDLAGIDEGYFILNKYWWAFPKVLEEAKIEADSWQSIGNGDIFIFKYKK
jgi:hypothetical protein